GPSIDLLLTDIVMPNGISGTQLAEQIRGENPEIKIMFTSGYPKDVLQAGNTLLEGTNFLSKPYPPQLLAQTVRHCLDHTTCKTE
ncbi:MAG: response regulator, partial [Limisphaerales bacterium]